MKYSKSNIIHPKALICPAILIDPSVKRRENSAVCP